MPDRRHEVFFESPGYFANDAGRRRDIGRVSAPHLKPRCMPEASAAYASRQASEYVSARERIAQSLRAAIKNGGRCLPARAGEAALNRSPANPDLASVAARRALRCCLQRSGSCRSPALPRDGQVFIGSGPSGSTKSGTPGDGLSSRARRAFADVLRFVRHEALSLSGRAAS